MYIYIADKITEIDEEICIVLFKVQNSTTAFRWLEQRCIKTSIIQCQPLTIELQGNYNAIMYIYYAISTSGKKIPRKPLRQIRHDSITDITKSTQSIQEIKSLKRC